MKSKQHSAVRQMSKQRWLTMATVGRRSLSVRLGKFPAAALSHSEVVASTLLTWIYGSMEARQCQARTAVIVQIAMHAIQV